MLSDIDDSGDFEFIDIQQKTATIHITDLSKRVPRVS